MTNNKDYAINYSFNTWRVSGETVPNIWDADQLKFVRGGENRAVLTNAHVANILYLYHVKGLTAKEVAKQMGGTTQSIGKLVRGKYKSCESLYNHFMYMLETCPEKIEAVFAIKTYNIAV